MFLCYFYCPVGPNHNSHGWARKPAPDPGEGRDRDLVCVFMWFQYATGASLPPLLLAPTGSQEKPPENLNQRTPRTPTDTNEPLVAHAGEQWTVWQMGVGPGILLNVTSRGLSPCTAKGGGIKVRSTSPQHKTGLRDFDRPGACHPETAGVGQPQLGAGLRGPFGRSRRFFVTATGVLSRGHGLPTHWSGGLCRPGPRRGPQPRAASGP